MEGQLRFMRDVGYMRMKNGRNWFSIMRGGNGCAGRNHLLPKHESTLERITRFDLFFILESVK
jgi:hypothetical protein